MKLKSTRKSESVFDFLQLRSNWREIEHLDRTISERIAMSAKSWFVSMFQTDYTRARSLMSPSQYAMSLAATRGVSPVEQYKCMAEYIWEHYVASREPDPILERDIYEGYREHLASHRA